MAVNFRESTQFLFFPLFALLYNRLPAYSESLSRTSRMRALRARSAASTCSASSSATRMARLRNTSRRLRCALPSKCCSSCALLRKTRQQSSHCWCPSDITCKRALCLLPSTWSLYAAGPFRSILQIVQRRRRLLVMARRPRRWSARRCCAAGDSRPWSVPKRVGRVEPAAGRSPGDTACSRVDYHTMMSANLQVTTRAHSRLQLVYLERTRTSSILQGRMALDEELTKVSDSKGGVARF
jgi:hypothetical protein